MIVLLAVPGLCCTQFTRRSAHVAHAWPAAALHPGDAPAAKLEVPTGAPGSLLTYPTVVGKAGLSAENANLLSPKVLMSKAGLSAMAMPTKPSAQAVAPPPEAAEAVSTEVDVVDTMPDQVAKWGCDATFWERIPKGARKDIRRYARDGKEDLARARIATMREIAAFADTLEPTATWSQAVSAWEEAEEARLAEEAKAAKAAQASRRMERKAAEEAAAKKAAEEAAAIKAAEEAAAAAKAAEEAAAKKAAEEAAAKKAAEEAAAKAAFGLKGFGGRPLMRCHGGLSGSGSLLRMTWMGGCWVPAILTLPNQSRRRRPHKASLAPCRGLALLQRIVYPQDALPCSAGRGDVQDVLPVHPEDLALDGDDLPNFSSRRACRCSSDDCRRVADWEVLLLRVSTACI